jgi:hypothetical protein
MSRVQHSVTVPAGEYWIGDPCYFGEPALVQFSTAWGDGLYLGGDGFEYCGRQA